MGSGLKKRVARVIEAGTDVTYDLGGDAGTVAMTDAIIKNL